jgi:hypothetical protein
MTLVRVVLFCAMVGYPIGLPGIPEKEPDEPSGSRAIFLHGTMSVNGCGIFPAVAGTAWGFTSQ